MPDLPDAVFAAPCGEADALLCARYGVRVVDVAPEGAWTLQRTELGELELAAPANEEPLRVSLDLSRGDLARRLRTASKEQPLSRACGLHRRDAMPSVFDATAGLGRDALLLAKLGCTVTACERIGALCLLLAEAAARTSFADRIEIVHADACAELDRRGRDSFDVVLLDPMFPSQGSAQVKKEMQLCRRLAGAPDSTELLAMRALAAARDRLVVKRHPHEEPLCGTPSYTSFGERVRFDVHLKPKAARPAP